MKDQVWGEFDALLFLHTPAGASYHTVVRNEQGQAIDYTFDAVNPAFETLTGLKAGALLGRTATQVFPVTDKGFFAKVFRVAETGEPVTFDFWSVPLSAWLRLTAFRHKPDGFGTTFLPVPSTTKPVEPAGLDEARYHTFFNLPNAVKLIIDVESHYILDANPGAVAFYGWSRDELRHMRIDEIAAWAPEKVSQVVDAVGRGELRKFTLQHRLRNGEVRDVEVYSTTGPWGQGQANYAIVHDVTETKLLERRSLQAERLKAVGELTASLYHEFGNLLGILFSHIQLLELEVPPGPTRERFQARIHGQFVRARKLIDSVKRFSRRQDAEAEACLLSPLLEDLIELEKPICRASGIDVSLTPASGDWVAMDAALLQQMCLNLFKNSVEALVNAPQKDISMAVTVEGSQVMLTFGDSGPGIPQEVRSQLFTPFFTTKGGPGGEGTGLGLSFTRTLLQNHGGSIELDPGASTMFRIHLPLGHPSGQGVAKPKERSAP